MLVLKAVSSRKETTFPCDGPHDEGVPAVWELEIALLGTVRLCTGHYREFTEWECGNERKCNRINYGLTQRCVCGWVRPDTCRKCNQISAVPLIKITEKREPHPCHECDGRSKARGIATCAACNGNIRTEVVNCLTCSGSGHIIDGDKKCSACDGIGKSTRICKVCKGAGEAIAWTDKTCTSCKGTGTCNASSANWGVDRIPLTDIAPEHQDKLKPYVGQHLCFRCANPDFQFSPYREDKEPLQCFHFKSTPDGQERCTQSIAQNNPNKLFCFAHSKSHVCSVCDKRLKLDEWGGRCREHAKCARCGDKPVEGSLFCPSHQSYKALGRMLEKQTSPESPFQILKAQEGVYRARATLARRRVMSLERSRRNNDALMEAEKAQYDVLFKDSQVNQWRREEVRKIEAQIEGLDKTVPEGKEKENELKLEVRTLERQIDEGRELEDRVALRVLAKKIKKFEERIKDDLAVYVRYRHIGKELLELSDRLSHLRHYELWDRKSTPEYFGEPEMVLCKTCMVPFNVRTPMKWFCPRCTTPTEVEVGNVGRNQPSRDLIAIVYYPTNNEPQYPHVLRLICEVCRNEVKKVKPTRLLIPERFGRSDSDAKVIPAIYFACVECISNESIAGIFIREKKAKTLLEEIGKRRTSYEESRKAIRNVFSDLDDERRKDLERRGLRIIDLNNFRFANATVTTDQAKPEAQLVGNVQAFPIPPSQSMAEIEKQRKENEKVARHEMCEAAVIKYAALINKDELTSEDRLEAGRLRLMILDGEKEFKDIKLPKVVVRKETIVPPPPPSRWSRRK